MRDALRAVGLIIGAFALLMGGVGLLRGQLNPMEQVAGGVGLVLLTLVAVTPAGKRPPSLYEDWDRPQNG